MPSQMVTLEMTVAQAAAVKNIDRVTAAFRQMKSALGDVGPAGKGTSDKLEEGFNKTNAVIARAAKAFLSLNMGMRAFSNMIAAVSSELEKYKQYNQTALQKQVQYGESLRNTALIAGIQDPTITADYIDKKITENRGVVNKVAAAKLVETAVSGRATLSTAEAIDAAMALAPILRTYDPSTSSEVARSAVMMRESFGYTAEEAAGTFLSVMGQSNITDPGLVAKNLINPALTLVEYGYSPEEALKSLVMVQTMAKDVVGNISRTAFIKNIRKVMDDVREFGITSAPEAVEFARATGRYAEDPRAIAYHKRLMGTLKFQREDLEEERREAEVAGDEEGAGELFGRAGGILGIEKFYASPGESEAADRERRAVQENMKTGAEAATRTEKLMRQLDTSMALLPLRIDEIGNALEEDLAADPAAAVFGKLQQFSENLGPKLGDPGFFEDWLAQFEAKAIGYRDQGDPVKAIESYIEYLKYAAARVARVDEEAAHMWQPGAAYRVRGGEDLTKLERSRVLAIERTVEAVQELLIGMKETMAAQAEAARIAAETPTEVKIVEDDTREVAAPEPAPTD